MAPLRTIFGIDLRTLALFRVLLGVYILIDLAMRSRDLVSHYTDAGIMPRSVQIDHLYITTWSLHLANGAAWFQALLFVLAGFAAIGLLVGWRTRAMTAISWLLMLSVQNRNTFILSGEDNLALLMLFWAMFLPLGARCSVDAALDRTNRFTGNDYFTMATMALLLQGMSMYFFSALLKTHPIWYQDGTAVHYALQLDYLVTPFALWFRQFHELMAGLTYYVYALELVGPFLIFSPIFHRTLRTIFMLAFMTMHLSFLLFLEIGFFPFISIIMNLTFMPGWMWDKLAGWLPLRCQGQLTIWYDRGCDFCEKSCQLLRVFLFLGDTPVRPAQDDAEIGAELERQNSWVVSEGECRHFKTGALAALAGTSPVFFPLGWLLRRSLVQAIGDRCYGWVGRNRPLLSRFTARWLPWRLVPQRFGPVTQVFAGLFLVFITVQNVSTLPGSGVTLPDGFRMVRQALGLYQNWTMFAPYPEMTSPWPVIEGELTDGTIVDVYHDRPGLADFEKPAVVSKVYANYRWRKFLSQLEDQTYEDVPQTLALAYGRYLCGHWREAHPDGPALSSFILYFQIEISQPPGVPKEVETQQVWSHDCFG
ncbi:HTTM domain-containing protein [Roseibium sediminicola]|uniref:HTTM domain-containing protein n=1 Tax=Roseibium sediminicola TaxID=2933272 RepID=A0ABT0GMM7_9HYPH|nr:HTTM domain-containing protein [Roseibium sp. CAU 1639]MCK7610674.1 HTTM domain-containing protein [Roseibium sp. CAU 1639]